MLPFAKKQVPTPTDQDIVGQFFELVSKGGIFAKPLTNLPAQKAFIKQALLAALDQTTEPQTKAGLTKLYLKLADFQILSSVEQGRIRDFLTMIGAMWAQHGTITEEQNKSLPVVFGSDHIYGGVIDRVQREVRALKAELVKAGHLSNADLAADAKGEANAANALADQMGLSMTFTAADFQSTEQT